MIESVEQADRSTTVRKLLHNAISGWKIEYFARQYGDGKTSLSRAARGAGVTTWQMMGYVRQRKIPAQYAMEDWEHDVETVNERVARPGQ